MSESQEFIIELTYSALALDEHPDLTKSDMANFLVPEVPAVGDGVSFVINGANADLIVERRRFVFEAGRTAAQLHLGLAK